MTVAPGERSLSVTAVVWALMTATGQIPIAALVTKLLAGKLEYHPVPAGVCPGGDSTSLGDTAHRCGAFLPSRAVLHRGILAGYRAAVDAEQGTTSSARRGSTVRSRLPRCPHGRPTVAGAGPLVELPALMPARRRSRPGPQMLRHRRTISLVSLA